MSMITELPKIIKGSERKYNSLDPAELYVSEETGTGNILCHGENSIFMKSLAAGTDVTGPSLKGKINLIYIDPPFFSKADYDAVVKVGEENVRHKAYGDKWQKGMSEYLKMLTVRLLLMKDLMASDGTIWIHLDWHVVHYAKIIMDEIFGEKYFVNEIIWTYKSGGSGKKHFSRKHDTILVYGKTSSYYFNPIKEKSYNRGFKPYRFKGVKEYRDEMGWYTMVNMKDVWQIDMVGRTSSERTGYATQKPEALLERILMSATKPGDICADFFCGSGTLPAVAERLERKWIVCDNGSLAVENTIKRMSSRGSSFMVCCDKESSCAAGSKGGKAEISSDVKEMVTSDAALLTISIERYRAYGLSGQVDSETLNLVKDTARADSLQLVQAWSIDYDYDGMVHRPDTIFVRNGKNLETTCQKLINKSGEIMKIGVKVVDVFGNTSYTEIEI